MQLHKTERARAELKPGVRTLGQRERTLLLLADGNKSVQDFRPLFAGEGEQIALRLLRDGYLETHSSANKLDTKAVSELPTSMATTLDQNRSYRGPENTQAVRVSADQFDGKRSLATTRMFLFDICERMFARRNPVLADRFREGLRSAKDRNAMLAVSREMIDEIEKVAGHERADSISERLAMILPSDEVAV